MHGRWRRHCLPIEFRQVQGHFPIVFRRDLETGKVSALALFGFENEIGRAHV